MAGALIGALRVSLSAETTAFEAGMRRAQKSAQSTAANINKALKDNLNVSKVVERSVIGFVTALTLGTLVRAGKEVLDYAGHLGELADTLGLTTKDLQTFSYAAGQVGISQDELQVGIQKLTVSMGQAELGAKKQTAAFKAIGISVDELKGKSTGDVFREIADRLEKVGDRSQRAAVEVALFGKAGAKLDNLLSGSQGSLNELSAAAEKLGIVLSDEQIRKADETADKIAALQTVLKANVARAVADNAEAILGLANVLARFIGTVGQAAQGWRILVTEFKAGAAALSNFQNPFAAADKAVRVQAFHDRLSASVAAIPGTPRIRGGGADIGQFLGGGGGKAKKDHSADELRRKQLEALRQAYDYQRDELNSQKDILEAKKDLSEDYVEQTSLQIAILSVEREQYAADLAFKVKQNELSKGQDGLTQAQADHLLAQYDITDSYKRQKVLADEQEQRQRDVGMLAEHDFARRTELLEKLEDLATTQSERRKIELDLLELAYEEKKQALQRIIDNSKDAAAIEDARRDLVNLQAGHAADRQAVLQRTRGPLEDWAATVPKTAAEINEALQSIEAQGLDGLADAIGDVITGTRSLKEAFGDLAKSIIADLIRMSIRMLIFRALTSIFGGALGGGSINSGALVAGNNATLSAMAGPLPGFASGGSFNILGRRGRDANVLALNGLPIANVNYGERLTVGNDNRSGSSRTVINQTFAPNFAGNAATHEDLVRMAAITKAATMDALRDQGRRR